MQQESELAELTRRFARDAGRLRFGGAVTHVYNPLAYAWEPHELYLRRYAAAPKRAVFLGMNPGPFGMAQTGVPFGEVAAVRDWLGISAPVGRPPVENPKRPVLGFACPRSEISGARLWDAIAGLYGAPENFFANFFVANYCPLVFMEAGGQVVLAASNLALSYAVPDSPMSVFGFFPLFLLLIHALGFIGVANLKNGRRQEDRRG